MKAEFPTPVEFVATLFISVLSSSESARYMNLENKQIRIFICPIKIQKLLFDKKPDCWKYEKDPDDNEGWIHCAPSLLRRVYGHVEQGDGPWVLHAVHAGVQPHDGEDHVTDSR